jgi:hypothetical protein
MLVAATAITAIRSPSTSAGLHLLIWLEHGIKNLAEVLSPLLSGY